MEDFELFDEMEIKPPVQGVETPKEEKQEEKLDVKTIDINKSIQELQAVKENEEEFEDTPDEEVEETEEEVVETTEEQKELQDQFSSLKEIGALFLPDDYQVETIEKALQDSEAFRNEVALNTVFNSFQGVNIPGIGNAQDLFAYIYKHGGTDVEQFKQTFGENSFNPNSYNLDEEGDRRKVLELLYKEKGFTEVKSKKLVDKIFEDLEDDSEAKEALEELTALDNKNKQAHLAQLENSKKENEKKAQEAYSLMDTILKTKDEVGGFHLGKDEKPKALESLYTEVNVGGNVMSEFNYRLQHLVLTNPELTLALSGFLNTLSKDNKGSMYFDLSKFKKAEKTKVTKSLADNISRATAGKRRFTSSSDETQKQNNFSWDSVVDLPGY